ncbi:MAG: DinB family protein [Bacteroidia bacterium]
MNHELFFTNEYIPLLQKLKGDEKGNWGLLSPQGMIEHMTDSIGVAWGRIPQPSQTPEHLLQRMRDFALSDKEFKPGTKNSLMNETPDPLRKANISEARGELEAEIKNFVNYYKTNPGAIITNPFFGDFNYEQWLHLLHKHALHHLKQFSLV